MSHVKAWLVSLRRSLSASSDSANRDDAAFAASEPNEATTLESLDVGLCLFSKISFDVLLFLLCFLDHRELHTIVRRIDKQCNQLCDAAQKTLKLSTRTPIDSIRYWMLKLCNVKHIDLSRNHHVDNQFLVWLRKDYFPLKIREKEKRQMLRMDSCSASGSRTHRVSSADLDLNPIIVDPSSIMGDADIMGIDLHLHLNISFCFGIDCVQEPQLYGRGGVNGHNDYLKKLINLYTQYGIQFNFYGNFRIINPSPTLRPRHVVELQLYSLKLAEVQHCFKFASPANRQFTGPLPRFERMVTNGYPILIHWTDMQIVEVLSEDDGYMSPLSSDEDDGHAPRPIKHFIVEIHKKHRCDKFKWTVSRQKITPYVGCWMTDSVCPFDS